jgi:hypothetical protein
MRETLSLSELELELELLQFPLDKFISFIHSNTHLNTKIEAFTKLKPMI